MNPIDRVKLGLAKFIDSAVRRMDYLALYPCKVVSQGADDTLELQPDDARIPGLSKVPIRHGLPGVKVKVNSGARILLGFENGDPRQPYAALWTMNGADLQEIQIGNSPSKHMALAEDVKAKLDFIINAFNLHQHLGVQSGAGTSGTPVSTISLSTSVASATVKST